MSAEVKADEQDPMQMVQHASKQMAMIVRALDADRQTLREKLAEAIDKEQVV